MVFLTTGNQNFFFQESPLDNNVIIKDDISWTLENFTVRDKRFYLRVLE